MNDVEIGSALIGGGIAALLVVLGWIDGYLAGKDSATRKRDSKGRFLKGQK